MARPTKLTPEMIAEAEVYVFGRENSKLNDATIIIQKAAEDSRKLAQWGEREGDDLPTIEGLALRLRISRDTLYSWANEYPDFGDIVEFLLLKQSNQLQQRGIKGDYSSTVTKLLLTKHGYADRTENDNNNNHSGEVNVVEVVRFAPKESDSSAG